MGHNKNYTKFSNYSNNNKPNQNEVLESQVAVEELIPEVVTEFEELTSEEVTNLNEEDVANVNTDLILECFVAGCKKLNVREKPSKESTVLCVIDENDTVTINTADDVSEDFYKVCTSKGIEGYCMKQFISVK